MKGISTIIASIILVVITIGLIATAYLYFAGIVSVGPVVSIGSGYCDGSDDIHVSIRNEGTADLDLNNDDFAIDGTSLIAADFTTGICLNAISAGDSASCTIASKNGVALVDGTLYNLAVYGPRNTASGPIQC